MPENNPSNTPPSPAHQGVVPTPPEPSSKNVALAVTAAIILTALIVGGGVYAWQRSVSQKQQAQLQQQVQTLQQLPVSEVTAVPTTPTVSNDPRPLAEPTSISGRLAVYVHGYPPGEIEAFGTPRGNLPATTTVPYSNTTKGLSIELPFNPQWGTDKYRIAEYVENDEVIVYGPLGGCEGGGLCREDVIIIRPSKTAAQVMAEARQSSDNIQISQRMINSLEVVQYAIAEGLCSNVSVTVIGKKYNYEFIGCAQFSGGPDFTQDLQQYDNLIRTIKLL